MRYRKKPVVVDAFRIPSGDEGAEPFTRWAEEMGLFGHFEWVYADGLESAAVLIRTLEGTMRGDPGDWVIRGVKGEFYPCKDEIFRQTYEAVR